MNGAIGVGNDKRALKIVRGKVPELGNVVGDVQSTQGGERRLRAQERDVWDTRRIQDSKLASGVCVLRNINKRSCAKPITRISQLSAKGHQWFLQYLPSSRARSPSFQAIYKRVNRKKNQEEERERSMGHGFGTIQVLGVERFD